MGALGQTVTTVVGTGVAGAGDGEMATASKIHDPYGVFVDSAGIIYFTTAATGYVRYVGIDGILHFFAGEFSFAGFNFNLSFFNHRQRT